MLTTVAPLGSNIDLAAGASLEARIDRAPLSRSDVARRVDRLNRVFYAGFSSKVVDEKWDAFETAFEPARCAFMTDERLGELLNDKRIVRNGAKIESVQQNGRFVVELAKQHGSAARFFADWPDADYVSLLELLKKRASRLGGETGMRFLRSIGKPAFIPTPDVVKALVREKVIGGPPTGKRDLKIVQEVFNSWSEQSGLDLTSISRTLAMTVG